MGFEYKVVMFWRAFGKAAHHNFQKLGHGRKGRMHPEACIMLKLEKGQVIGEATIANTPRGNSPFKRMHRHHDQTVQMQLELS